jgi:peroxiredoxin
MVPLGTKAPPFALPDVRTPAHPIVRDTDFAGAPALLVMFICNHCPFVVHIREPLARLVEGWQARGVAVVGISSNDLDRYPQDGPGPMAQIAAEARFSFPYLFDADQSVATAYQAACTPDFFLFDAERRLVYRGQLDGARPGNGVEVDGADLGRAIDAVLAGEPPVAEQRPSLGCNIKWSPGREPPWFG